MKINLLAIDEAHCISQWGYDFRPPYLEIGKFREILPDVPCLALTATATPKVQEDIIEKLDFRQKNQFQKSFARHNLSYSSFEVEDKFKKLLNILKGVPGSSVVYVRSRKRTKQIADFLVAKGISASFYHAGLENQERSKRQDAWIKGHTRVVVATNAFGMGIDKPDVRSVVHMDLPDNPEAYYQEAGRAGRDEHKAYAVLLYSPEDILLLRERTEASYPAIPTIKKVYQCLANYFRLAIGSGKFTTFDFDLDDFCKTYQLPRNQAYHSIKRLEDQGYLQMNEAFFAPSRLWVSASKDDLYSFTIAHSNYSSTIKILLRVYGGELFTHYQHISEYKIAQLLKRSPQEVKSKLKYMDEQNIVSYVPQQDQPQLLFLTERLPAESLPLAVKEMENRRMLAYTKAETMVNYASNQHRCRTGMLLDYFGEYYAKHCGVCDFCISQKKNSADIAQEQRIDYLIRQKLADNHCSLEQLMESLPPGNQQQIKDILRGMIDFKEIIRLPDGKLKLREQN